MDLSRWIVLVAGIACSAGAMAQAYSNKPIRWIIPCIEPVGNTPEQAGRFLEDEIAKWSKVITTAGVKAEQ
ncbi:MAG: hypothetical protein HYU75_17760 [Betaproteobacteria bacterium]|nr:hypothetical protein [Betaproteobacteria bacterium]